MEIHARHPSKTISDRASYQDYSRWAKPDSLVTCDHSRISQTPHMLHKTVKGGSFSFLCLTEDLGARLVWPLSPGLKGLEVQTTV